MAPMKLEGPTLGHKHRIYNQIVKESILNQTSDTLKYIDFNEDDVSNLVKIDMASVKRNVDYILGILKGNDMLYISRAIARCPWLITDSTYAHIINPEYLHSHLLPNMMAKAGNKLMLHIRLNLRDETRVESFFNYYEHLNLKTALKWLPHCSAVFMETKVEKYRDNITRHLLKRLCEKSYKVLEIFVRASTKQNLSGLLEFRETMFLITTHTDFYLDLLDTQNSHDYPKFNAKYTKFLMKACPERIHQNFSKYVHRIHIPTFAKSLDRTKVREFLLTQANIEERNICSPGIYYPWLNSTKLTYFLKVMPNEERVNFIRDVFGIRGSKIQDKDKIIRREEVSGMARISKFYHEEILRCLPFEAAFTEYRELIKNTDGYSRSELFKSLIAIADSNKRHLKTLLRYYNDSYLADSTMNQHWFLYNFFVHPSNVLSDDSEYWSLLTNILNTIVIDDTFSQVVLRALLVHEVINKREVPDNIIKHFEFSPCKEFQKIMNIEEKSLLFEYLYNYLVRNIKDCRNNFYDLNSLMASMLALLNTWGKKIADYPYVFEKIKELIKLQRDEHIDESLAWIYDVNKSWRKCMFEESIILCKSEQVFCNALKHDASLLSRNEKVLAEIRGDDKVSLRQLFMKIKVYWPDSFAYEWSQSYRELLAQPIGHKAIMRGLSSLLPQRELSDIINVYKPEDATINWEKDDEVLISLRKHVAKNMHFARPQPTIKDILQYAKGDYLQFALPSLNAILFNVCATSYQEFIPKLLNTPVSLQKHIIRLAFAKMQSEDLPQIFCNHWKTVKNLSIRAVLFKITYELLCKEQNPTKIDNIWRLLKVFLDDLSFEEDKAIYELLGQVEKVPRSVRPFFVMRSYTFLKALLPKSDLDKNKYEQCLENLICEINNLVESIEPEFVANIFQEYYAAVYTQDKSDEFVHNNLMPLLASYVLCAANEEIHVQRYEKVLLPLLKYTVAVWADKDKNDNDLRNLLRILQQKLKHDDNVISNALFSDILNELEKSLGYKVAYLMLTEWKLTTAFAKVINDTKALVDRKNFIEHDDYWTALCSEALPLFGKICLDFLRADIKTLFPCIYVYFSEALCYFFGDLISEAQVIEVLKNMLAEDLTQSYLVAIRVLPVRKGYDYTIPQSELQKKIVSHPSLEVRMHFYHIFDHCRYKYFNDCEVGSMAGGDDDRQLFIKRQKLSN